MNNEGYKIITNEIASFLKKHKYEPVKDEVLEYFSNGERAVIVDHDETASLIHLKNAVLKDGESVDFKIMSSWYFDDKSTDKDKQSIINDFTDSLSEMLGVKVSTTGVQAALPTKKNKVEVVDIENFSARFLAIYPAHKDDYRNNVSKYGEFMYDEFFRTYGVCALKTVLRGGNRKQINKYIDFLSDSYVNGDESVVSTVVYTIMTGALIDEPELLETAYTYMEKNTYLSAAVRNMLNIMKKPKIRAKYGF